MTDAYAMASAPTRAAPTYDRSPFVFDLRAIGIFRILLATTILFDQFILIGDWEAFRSAAGVVSAADSRGWGNPWIWSVYWLSDGPLLPFVLEILRFAASVTLLLGIRSRLSAFLLFVILASVAARNPLILQGGDRVLVVVTFFAAFLPLGQRFSITRLWFGETAGASYRSAATVAFAVQVLLVWFMAGILKTGDEWWSDGTAISMALHMESFATEFARLWRHWDWLVQPMTLFVFWLECLAPLLVLVPSFYARVVGLVLLVALEIGIYLSLEVGLFPLISFISLVPLTPRRIVDFFAELISEPPKRKRADLTLLFDRDCRFCAFACRFLLACCGIRGAEIRDAQSDPVAARILDDHFAWSVRERPDTPGGATAPVYRQGWDAVLWVIAKSPRPWLARILPGPRTGARLYGWIGSNRGAIGSLGGILFGRANTRGWHGPAGRLAVSCAITAVLAWNAVAYPPLREIEDLRPWVVPLVSLLNLKQYWNMFAPRPHTRDAYHVFPALRRDGREVDLLSGEIVTTEPPPDGPDRYGGYRWRKAIGRSIRQGELERITRYFCRTGDWAAMDVWVYRRPNLGTAATGDQPYEAIRLRRSRCTNADEKSVARFQARVDATLGAEIRLVAGGAAGVAVHR